MHAGLLAQRFCSRAEQSTGLRRQFLLVPLCGHQNPRLEERGQGWAEVRGDGRASTRAGSSRGGEAAALVDGLSVSP